LGDAIIVGDKKDELRLGFTSEGVTNLVAEAKFACKLCRKEAGVVELIGKPTAALIHRDSFVSTSDYVVKVQQYEQAREALDKRDIGHLYRINREIASFFCPKCNACYCGDRWDWWPEFEEDGWYDCTNGRRPAGHTRTLED